MGKHRNSGSNALYKWFFNRRGANREEYEAFAEKYFYMSMFVAQHSGTIDDKDLELLDAKDTATSVYLFSMKRKGFNKNTSHYLESYQLVRKLIIQKFGTARRICIPRLDPTIQRKHSFVQRYLRNERPTPYKQQTGRRARSGNSKKT